MVGGVVFVADRWDRIDISGLLLDGPDHISVLGCHVLRTHWER